MDFKVYFVDIDNTILDFGEYVRAAMKEGFEKFGIGTFEDWMFDVFHRENTKLWEEIEKRNLTFEELQKVRWNIIFEKLGFSYDGPKFEKYFRDKLFDCAIPVEGAYELLEGLSKKGIVCTASNGPLAQQVNRLEISDMMKYFQEVFVSEGLGVSKPAAEFFEKALKVLNEGREEKILPEECLMIGDSMTSDMAGGWNAGLKTCFYERKPGSHDWAVLRKPDYVVEKLVEILDI